MELWQAAVLGLVEGLTEFVPVSSTGHLILASRLLGLEGPAVNAFTVVIQLGALLAAVVYYRRTLWALCSGLMAREAAAQRLFINLCLAALPLLAGGYLFGRRIKTYLFAPATVAAALIVGGAVMLTMELYRRRRPHYVESADQLSPARATLVGLVQTLALWPGASRSMTCILGGQLAGLGTATAADFAFLLALPTLGVATVYELLKEGPLLRTHVGTAPLALGLLISFAVGLLVISAFLRYLRRFGLTPFGWYRIATGGLLLAMLYAS